MELLVSIGLMGIVAATIGSVFVSGLRTYSRQIELSHVRANLRLASATLTKELRGLDAGDSLGSDISEMLPSSLTYRAARSTYFLCTVPDVARSTLTVWQSPFAGLRQLEPGRDSLLLFAENEVATPLDNVWVPAAVSSVTAGQFCPGGDAGLRLVVDGVSQVRWKGYIVAPWYGAFRIRRCSFTLTQQDVRGWGFGNGGLGVAGALRSRSSGL